MIGAPWPGEKAGARQAVPLPRIKIASGLLRNRPEDVRPRVGPEILSDRGVKRSDRLDEGQVPLLQQIRDAGRIAAPLLDHLGNKAQVHEDHLVCGPRIAAARAPKEALTLLAVRRRDTPDLIQIDLQPITQT